MSKLFDRVNKHLPEQLPSSSGTNVFLSSDYAKEMGLSREAARARLDKLIDSGVLRRVRTRRNGNWRPAYEYIEGK